MLNLDYIRQRTNVPSVLLVEDEPSDVEAALRAKDKLGAELNLTIALTGDEAIGQALDQRYDVIFLDLGLPGTSGLEVLAMIRQQPACHNVPVVVLTSSDFDEDMKEAYARGANSFLQKSSRPDQMRQTLANAIAYWAGLNRSPSRSIA